MQRFFQANAAFFTQIIVKKAAIRAAMLESPADFPGIKAPEAAPAAAGASPGAQSKSQPKLTYRAREGSGPLFD